MNRGDLRLVRIGTPTVVSVVLCEFTQFLFNNNNNNNNCLKSNVHRDTSSVDYQPRELTHACSRSDMCYVFNVNLTDSFDDRRSQCRLIE